MILSHDKIEKILFVLFLITLPFTKRYTFETAGGFDANMVHLYISDVSLVLLLLYSGFTRNILEWRYLKIVTICSVLLLIGSLLMIPRETFTWYWTVKTIELGFLFVYFSNIPHDLIKTTFLPITISGIFQATLASFQFIFQKDLGFRVFGEVSINANLDGIAKINTFPEKLIRAYGTFPHPNPLSAFLVVACATCFYFLYAAKTIKERTYWNLALFILNIGLFTTFSRAAIVILLFQTVFLLFITVKLSFKTSKQVMLSTLATLVLVFILFTPYFKDRLFKTTPTSYSRTYYNQIGLQIIQENPFLGVGVGNMIDAVAKKVKPDYRYQVQPPHNYFLEVACETGLIGLTIILIIFLKGLWNTRPKFKEGVKYTTIVFTTLSSIFVLMFFDHYFYTAQQTQLLLWLLLGLAFNDKLKKDAALLQR